jgi:hypothetical protein
MLLEIIGIIIGYILGYYLMKSLIYINQNFHGPDSNIIRNTIYYQNGKYYRFIPEVCICID